MKNLNNYISEKLIVNNTISNYLYYPKTKDELIKCIKEKIDKEGLGTKENPLDLNDIDTSEITDMIHLFNGVNGPLVDLSANGCFDISDWNVSNVENMIEMFSNSSFNGDISDWDVSKVNSMSYMFFNSKFNGDISNWDVSNVEDFGWMFAGSKFNGDISNWNVKSIKYKACIFIKSPLQKNPPKWYK